MLELHDRIGRRNFGSKFSSKPIFEITFAIFDEIFENSTPIRKNRKFTKKFTVDANETTDADRTSAAKNFR